MKLIRIPSRSTCRHITHVNFLPASFDHSFSRTSSFGLPSLLKPLHGLRQMSSARASIDKPFPTDTVLRGFSGTSYKIKELLIDRRDPPLCVYRAWYILSNFFEKNLQKSELI